MSRRPALAVGALTALATISRCVTLDRQSYWSDEAITVLLTRMHFGGLWHTIGETESTPPVYYVAAWFWVRAFGDGEVALRSLSALAGVATVPVAYLAGRSLRGPRVGVVAAALATVSPPLVWYSQEARAYALAILLAGASFWAFARALRHPAASELAAWSIVSLLAIGTHYFAGFVVATEAAWLVARHGGATVWSAVAVTTTGAAALLLLALEQRENGFAESIALSTSLAQRAAVLPKQLIVGAQGLPLDRAIAVVAAVLLAVPLLHLLWGGAGAERRPLLVACTAGLAPIVVPVALALGGLDYINSRNALVGLVPLIVAAAVGLSATRRLGAVALGALVTLLAAISLVALVDATYQRPNWRGFAQSIGRPDVPRAIVVAPDHQGWFARVPLQLYLPGARAIDAGLVEIPAQFSAVSRRVDDHATPRRVVVGELVLAEVGWSIPSLPSSLSRDFSLVEERCAAGYCFRRYRSRRPHPVETRELVLPRTAVLLEEPVRS